MRVGTNQGHNINEIYDARLCHSTNVLNDAHIISCRMWTEIFAVVIGVCVCSVYVCVQLSYIHCGPKRNVAVHLTS